MFGKFGTAESDQSPFSPKIRIQNKNYWDPRIAESKIVVSRKIQSPLIIGVTITIILNFLALLLHFFYSSCSSENL